MNRTHILSLTLAVALALPGSLAIAQTVMHEGHGATELALTLDNGAKWQGDASMIRGMSGIRDAMARDLAAIHDNALPSAGYPALAAEVQGQVDYMVENCHLAPEVDEQLHMVLGQVLEGTAEMEGGADPRAGAVRIVQALNAYGEHFEHPGWQVLE